MGETAFFVASDKLSRRSHSNGVTPAASDKFPLNRKTARPPAQVVPKTGFSSRHYISIRHMASPSPIAYHPSPIAHRLLSIFPKINPVLLCLVGKFAHRGFHHLSRQGQVATGVFQGIDDEFPLEMGNGIFQ